MFSINLHSNFFVHYDWGRLTFHATPVLMSLLLLITEVKRVTRRQISQKIMRVGSKALFDDPKLASTILTMWSAKLKWKDR